MLNKNFILFINACIVFLFTACGNKKENEEENPAPVKTAVTVIQSATQNFYDYLELNGNTQFQKKLVIRANITGYIVSMPWKVGDRIKTGSLFCTIKTKEQDALKNIDSREPSLKQFQTPLNVIAGAAGNITAINYSKGDFITEGDVLATITDPSSLVLVVNVPYEYHNLVYKGRSCLVKFPDGKNIAANIQEEIPFVDSATQTQSYLIRIPGNQLLPENLNLLVQIPIKQKVSASALPLEAIQTNETQDEFWVMKLVNDSIAVKVPITVGLQKDSMREILTGLGMMDKIIVKGAYGLVDSSLVSVEK
jgi:multidrug efflux pump subunit AcrA (membrane-fusion protein)